MRPWFAFRTATTARFRRACSSTAAPIAPAWPSRYGTAIVRIAEIEGRDRDRICAGIATAPEPKRKGAAAPGRSGPCVTTRIAHPRYYRVARLMLDMVRSPYGKVFISSPMRRTARA